ncbi:MAG: DUF151 domain-containing protein [Bacteroidales bacterium]|jgi:bifunctional DNase/RNase|nr:DUF151 domain-containing protein [Bacteroidales bacterium]
MDFVELSVVTVTTYGKVQNSAYIVVLEDKAATKRIPIIIGIYEGHFIELALVKAVPPRPLTHDLFVGFMKATKSTLQDVLIYKFSESIFYSRLNFVNEKNESFSVEARTSDAIAIALRCEAPIYTTEEIMNTVGIPVSELVDNTDEYENDDENFFEEEDSLQGFSVEELSEFLQEAIDREDYERAALIRDKINQCKREEGEG